MTIFVAFNTADAGTIIASFSSAQNEVVWPNQGTVEPTDQRWLDYKAKFPAGTFAS